MVEHKVFTQRTIDQINNFINEKLFQNLYPGGFTLAHDVSGFDREEEQIQKGQTDFEFDYEFYELTEGEALLAHFYEGCVFFTDDTEELVTKIQMHYDKDDNTLEVTANFVVNTWQGSGGGSNSGADPVVILDGRLVTMEEYYEIKFDRSYEDDFMEDLHEDYMEKVYEDFEGNFKKSTDCDVSSRAASTIIQLED